MKCPNCEGELPGSVFVCKACGHRLTQASLEKWRKAHTSAENEAAVPESALAAKTRARFAQKKSESNLIQFPVPANVTAAPSAKSEPDWRAQLKNRVQDHRARHDAVTLDAERQNRSAHETLFDEPEKKVPADQLLLVESALKRIQRTASPPATVGFRAQQKPLHYPAAQSHALALMPDAERYAEEQRLEEASLSENLVEGREAVPAAPPVEAGAVVKSKPSVKRGTNQTAAAQLRAVRTRKLTGAHLPPLVNEEPLLEMPDFTLESLPLAGDTLPVLEPAEPAPEVLPVERLRAKAEFFTEQQAEDATEEEPTWLTDEEAAVRQNNPHVWVGQPAPLWLRTLAGISDVEAAAILYLPFFSAYYAIEGSFDFEDYYLMAGMAVIVMFLYQLVTFTLNGRTIGMALFGLRNFDVEHAQLRISFSRRIQQALGGTVGLLLPPFNFIVTRVTGFQRGFGDALAKTVTLRRTQE
jgi:uncharacterized RDD family membrane protein YckC